MASDSIDYQREYFTLLDKYNELIYAVERKFDNESRHQTALRYIRETENTKKEPQQSAVKAVTPWIDPIIPRPKEWHATPIVPESPK
jgi:hypothetical protein